MNFNDALETIVFSRCVGHWMEIVDGYLRGPAGVPSACSLPEAHRGLAPIIERCSGDERAYLRLLEALRSSHQGSGDDQLGALIEKVRGRVAQADLKRARSRRAAAILIRAEPRGARRPLRGSVVEPTARQIEQAWDAGVMQTLRAVCRVHPRHELGLDEFEQLHIEFWMFVDDELAKGRVPLWEAQINIPREHH